MRIFGFEIKKVKREIAPLTVNFADIEKRLQEGNVLIDYAISDIETCPLRINAVAVERESVAEGNGSDAFGFQARSRFRRVDPVVLHISPSYNNYMIWTSNSKGRVGGARYVRKIDLESIIYHLRDMYSFSAKICHDSDAEGGYVEEAKSWEFFPRGESPDWINRIDIFCIQKGIRTFPNSRELEDYVKATERPHVQPS